MISEQQNIDEEFIYTGYSVISRLQSYFGVINEAVFEIEQEVNLLYDTYGKDLLEIYKEKPEAVYSVLKTGEGIHIHEMTSKVFKSGPLAEAHQVNPVKIQFGFYNFDPIYSPKEKTISISLNHNAIIALGPNGFANHKGLAANRGIKRDLSEMMLKDVISHELAHWLDYSIRKFHLTKMLDRKPKTPLTLSYPETNAIMTALTIFKKKFSQEEWDTMSFRDFLREYGPLMVVYTFALKKETPEEIRKWQKGLFQRMATENLLGRNMYPLTPEEVKSL
jgi:hypothetical protein